MPSVARSGEMGTERGGSRFRDGTAGNPPLTKPEVPFLTKVLFILAGTTLTLFVLLMLASRADAATSASSGKGSGVSAGAGVSVGGVSVGANVSGSGGGGAATVDASGGGASADAGASGSSTSSGGGASVTTSHGSAGVHAGSSGASASADTDVARATARANGTNLSGRIDTPAGGAGVRGRGAIALPEPPLGEGGGNGGGGGTGRGDGTQPDRPGGAGDKPGASPSASDPQPDRPAGVKAPVAGHTSGVTTPQPTKVGNSWLPDGSWPPAADPASVLAASSDSRVDVAPTSSSLSPTSSLVFTSPLARAPHDRPSATSAGGAPASPVLDLQQTNGFLGGASLLLLTLFLAWLWASPRGPTPAPYLIPERPG